MLFYALILTVKVFGLVDIRLVNRNMTTQRMNIRQIIITVRNIVN